MMVKQNVIESFRGKYNWLSNFYSCVIEHEGVTYPTVEHAFQAAKTTDTAYKEYISKLGTLGKAKVAGRCAALREDWEKVKVLVMAELLHIKFSQDPLKNKLIKTGGAELIEENWWGDTFWGVYHGEGENILGKLLMQVRLSLKKKKVGDL